MKISEALRFGGLSRAALRRILCELLDSSFEKLFLRSADELDTQQERRFLDICSRFSSGEPLAYIFGRASFMGREFEVSPAVLIPRDETEILVLKCLEISKNFNEPVIFDICTGSGIIAISLALALPKAKIYASDISLAALKIAKQNAKKLGAKNIEFLESDLLDKLLPKADIIVSNPPYIANDYKLDIWLKSEPSLALFGGIRGDEILKRLVEQSAKRTRYLLCEMGYDQKNSMQKALSKHGAKCEFYKDLAGFDRGFIAQFF
nr:peptide chain release factor N(5)-glutamine methyltransferase [uncultured Campylobacter sp.]